MPKSPPKRPRGRPRILRGVYVVTTVSLAEPTYARLRHHGIDVKRSVRDLIRQAVDDYLAQHAGGRKTR